MNIFERIICALQTTHEKPTNYGAFHLISVACCVLITVLLCVFARKVKEKNFRLIVGVCSGVMILFEIYKQLIVSFDSETITWSYKWEDFPFQLCSTPLYLLPLVALMKDGKVRDGVMTFISSFAFFGGVCVFVFPNDVFDTSFLGIQIQTMVHHGLQIITGIYIAVYNRKIFKKRNFITATIIFAIMLVLALLLNIIMHAVMPERYFNMFYVSPYHNCILPILEMIYVKVPYAVFLMIYVIGFVALAILMLLIIYGGIKLATIISSKLKKD